MAEYKHTLSRVAFGGDWVESALSDHDRAAVRARLRALGETCGAVDHRGTAELLDLLDLVRRKVEKGPALTAALLRALDLENPGLRKAEVARCLRAISGWI